MWTLGMFVASALAQPVMPEMTVGWRSGNGRVRVQPPEGEHFAEGAPVVGWIGVAGVRVDLQTTSEALKGGLGIVLPGKVSHEVYGDLVFSLCQDGGTVCRIVDVSFWGMAQGYRGKVSLSVFPPGSMEAEPQRAPPDLEAAMARAQESSKLLLLDFSASWCPPCNLLSAQVLEDEEAAFDLEGFEVVVFDADLKSSWEAKNRYSVGGYPTVIVARPDGSVVERMEGYPGRDAMLAWLADASEASSSLEELAGGLAELDGDEAAHAALRLALSGQNDEALAALETASDVVEARMARLAVAPSLDDAFWLVEHAPERMNQWIWFLRSAKASLAFELTPEVQEAVLKAMPVAMAEIDGVDAAALGEWAAGWSSEPHQGLIYGLLVALLQEGMTGDPLQDRGLYSSLAHMQAQSGQVGSALSTLEDAAAAFPEDFTFHYALSSFLGELNELDRALESARLARKYAYGDNSLRAAHREASVLVALEQKEEALRLVTEALDANERPPEDLEVRTHRYLDKLVELQGELTAGD